MANKSTELSLIWILGIGTRYKVQLTDGCCKEYKIANMLCRIGTCDVVVLLRTKTRTGELTESVHCARGYEGHALFLMLAVDFLLRSGKKS